MKANYNLVLFLLKLSVSFGLLAYFFSKIDYDKLINICSSLDPFYVFFLLILSVIRILAAAIRFHLLVVKDNFKLISHIKHFFIAALFNNILPTAVGGDGVRVFLMAKHGIAKKQCLAYIVIDRTIGLLSLIVIAYLSSLIMDIPTQLTYIINVLFFTSIFVSSLVIVFTFLIRRKKVNIHIVIQHFETFLNITKPLPLFLSFVFSFVFQFIAIYTSYVIALAFNLNIDLILFSIIVPLVSLFVILPFSVGGLGIREMSFVYLFGLFSISAENALIISLGTYFTIIAGGVIGAFVYLYDKVGPSFHTNHNHIK